MTEYGKVLKILRKVDLALAAVLSGALLLSFAAMLALAVLQVFLRFFFHTGVVWGDEAARHLVIWVGFFGAYLATRERKHFRVDALVRAFPPRVRLGVEACSDLFAAAVCYFLLRASWAFVTVGIEPGAALFLGISERAVAMIVPVGFGLVGLRFLLRVPELLLAAVRGAPSGDAGW